MRINNLVDKDIAVHCDTRDKAEKFLSYCINIGVSNTGITKWYNSEKLVEEFDSRWFIFLNETCYSIDKYNDDLEVGYNGRQQYIDAGYKIIKFEELELED